MTIPPQTIGSNPPLKTDQSNNDQNKLPPIKLHPAVERTGEIIGSLVVGSFLGYGCYLISRGILYAASSTLQIKPLPFVLIGMTWLGVIETAQLTYDVSLLILGDRKKYETTTLSDQATRLDRFRHKSWKVINYCEKTCVKIDKATSSYFKIRTYHSLIKADLKPFYYMEIFRNAIIEQTKVSVKSFSFDISVIIVQAFGVSIPLVGQVALAGTAALFLLGIFNKFVEGFTERLKKEQEEKKQRQLLET